MTEISGIPDPIQVQPVDSGALASRSKPVSAVQGKSFKEVLLDNLNEVNRLQSEADQNVQRLLTGETDNVPEVLVAVNKAGIAFDLLMEIRNKLTDAYREIQQMRL